MRPIQGLFGILAVLVLSSTAFGQATAQVSGTVTDPTGALIPGVEVTVTQTETGANRLAVTNETGSYVLTSLPLGPYQLEAVLPGFQTFVQTGIVLQVNGAPVVNVTLEVGQVTQTIEVQANAAMVETRTVGIGQMMEGAALLELPLNGRNATELILLSGGAVDMGETSNTAFAGRLRVSVGGSQGYGTMYSLDGIQHYSPYDGVGLPLPFPDALQEFTVETSGLTARNGRAASVGAVTKSGTNEFHGDAFWFVRNDLFNARHYFADKGSTLKRNQYGGTIGGPVLQNKLFFFGGYQGTITRQDPADTRSFVPTAKMMTGDFTDYASKACNKRAVTLKAPFVNNKIDPALFSPAAVNLAGRIPRSTDPCGELTYGQREDIDLAQLITRVDYEINDSHSMFGRFIYDYDDRPSPLRAEPDFVLNSTERSFNNHATAFAFGVTSLLGGTTVNSFRIAASKTNVQRGGEEFFSATDLGIKNHYTYVPNFMTIVMGDGFNIGGRSVARARFRTTFLQIADDVQMVRGNHQISFGASLGHAHLVYRPTPNAPGIFEFDDKNTGLVLGDFLLGNIDEYRQGAPTNNVLRQTQVSMYVQDVWQLTPRLTANYGIRWAPNIPMRDQTNPVAAVMQFDIDKFKNGIVSKTYPNAPAGLLYAGDDGYEQSNRGVMLPNWANFGPRLGLAWDVTGDGRTSLRASYGISMDEFPLRLRGGNSTGQAPFGNDIRIDTPGGGFDDPWRDYPGGNPFPTSLGPDALFPYKDADYESQPGRVPPTTTGSWNVSLQRELATDWMASVSYSGSQIYHLWGMKALNDGVYIPGKTVAGGTCSINGVTVKIDSKGRAGQTCSTSKGSNVDLRRTLRLLDPVEGYKIGQLGEYDFGNTQSYNAMILSLERRAADGVTMTANYTWSHCVGYFGGRAATGTSLRVRDTYRIDNDRTHDKGNCYQDVRHTVNLRGVAESPEFDNTALRAVASNWRMALIYRVRSGSTLATNTGTDRALTGQHRSIQLPDVGTGEVYGDSCPGCAYISKTAIVQPAKGTHGDLGWNALYGPSQWQFDVALSRTFNFTEAQRMEFRVEAYNVTNSFRASNPAVRLNRGTFGVIRNSDDPRILQFAIKYLF
jgi:hypothetical protein